MIASQPEQRLTEAAKEPGMFRPLVARHDIAVGLQKHSKTLWSYCATRKRLVQTPLSADNPFFWLKKHAFAIHG
jgi:hypothetical protein